MSDVENNLRQLFLQYSIDPKQYDNLADAIAELHCRITATQYNLRQVTDSFKKFSRETRKKFVKVSIFDEKGNITPSLNSLKNIRERSTIKQFQSNNVTFGDDGIDTIIPNIKYME